MKYSKNKRWSFDEIDRQIFEEGLRITSVYFNKELDVMLILLSNKKVLQRKISRTGVHWSEIDEDLSLRSFLKEEMLGVLKNPFLAQAG